MGNSIIERAGVGCDRTHCTSWIGQSVERGGASIFGNGCAVSVNAIIKGLGVGFDGLAIGSIKTFSNSARSAAAI